VDGDNRGERVVVFVAWKAGFDELAGNADWVVAFEVEAAGKEGEDVGWDVCPFIFGVLMVVNSCMIGSRCCEGLSVCISYSHL